MLGQRSLATAVLLMAGSLMPAAASSQIRGATVPVTADADFTATGQSMWGPGDTGRSDFSIGLVDESWSHSGSSQDIQTFFGEKFGGDVSASTSGRFAFQIVFPGAGDATVGVTYPVSFQLDVPEPNSFAEGEHITIRTSHGVRPGAALSTDPVDLSMDFRGTLRTQFDASGRFCAFGCSSNIIGDWFPVGGQVNDASVFELSDTPSFLGGVSVSALPHTFSSAETRATGLEGTVGLPRPATTSSVEADGSLSAVGSAHYVNTALDVDRIMAQRGLPVSGSASGSKAGVNGTLSWTVASADLNLDMFLEQAFEFEPTLFTTVAFGAPVSWWVTDASGNTVSSATSSETTLEVGHDLHISFPDGRVTPLAADPVFFVEGTLSNHTTHRTDGSLDTEYGSFSFSVESASWTETVTRTVEETACSGWDPTGLICLITKTITNTITDTFNRVSNGVSLSEGPLATHQEDLGEETVSVFQDSWQLDGFSESAGPAFTLDPEDPIIAVASSLANTGLATGADYGTVTQTLLVENQGDVPLNATSVIDAVTPTGLGADLIESAEVTVNGAFDGTGDPETLGPGQTLPVGSSATVTLRWAATPGVHSASVLAGGTSPIGTLVEDDAYSAFGWLDMAVGDPGNLHTINRRSRGVTPVHLLGSDALSVDDVDRTSLAVEGVAPDRINAEDVDGDGIQDLTLLVPTPELVAALDERMAGYDDLTVLASSGASRDQGEATPVVVPADQVAVALLGDDRVSADDRAAMDAAGNGNGRLDVGDLRATLFDNAGLDAQEPVMAAARGGNGPPGNAGPPGGGEDEDEGDVWTLVLTGALDDGTELWAEDTARIIGEAR